jgi:hypothetical protein
MQVPYEDSLRMSLLSSGVYPFRKSNILDSWLNMQGYGGIDAHIEVCDLDTSYSIYGSLFSCEVSLGLGALFHQRQNALHSSN